MSTIDDIKRALETCARRPDRMNFSALELMIAAALADAERKGSEQMREATGWRLVAWAHEDGRVIRAETMEIAKRDGGATYSSVKGYTIPLYAAPEHKE